MQYLHRSGSAQVEVVDRHVNLRSTGLAEARSLRQLEMVVLQKLFLIFIGAATSVCDLGSVSDQFHSILFHSICEKRKVPNTTYNTEVFVTARDIIGSHLAFSHDIKSLDVNTPFTFYEYCIEQWVSHRKVGLPLRRPSSCLGGTRGSWLGRLAITWGPFRSLFCRIIAGRRVTTDFRFLHRLA